MNKHKYIYPSQSFIILMQFLNQLVDSSFKYVLLAFNLLTLVLVFIHKKRLKVTKQHHVLFVFAHPDDEAMFFGPTISHLTNQYYVHFLCLTHGTSIRAKELQKSALYFGIHRHQCIHHQNMIDGMKSKWCQKTIQNQVKQYVEKHNIKAIFTFDKDGISGHLNHRTIYKALSALEVPTTTLTLEEKRIADLKQEKEKKEKDKKEKSQEENPLKEAEKQEVPQEKKAQQFAIKIYYLETTNLLRKYTGLLELLIVPFKEYSYVRLNYFHGYNSMALHKSQWVWFRKLFVFFSRYTYVNTFQMKKIKFK